MNESRLFLGIGAVGGFFSVALGAFAAHALQNILSPGLLDVFHTGVQYQAIHSLALLAVGLMMERQARPPLRLAGWAFASGILLFSGSLYILATTDISWMGVVTPFGGLAFLLGWGSLTWSLLRN
jgi:uncharacterized membrane protein YgdD (TMEM256/DUF423 family)